MTVADGYGTAAIARDDDFDLVLLDLGLPGMDGLEVLAEIRRRGQRLPVIVLTARDAVPDRVAGLERGADDYVTKPFSFEELLARVRVRLRETGTTEETVLGAGALSLDLRTRRANVDDRTVELTAREFTLLEMFLRHRDQVLSPRTAAQPRVGLRLRPRLERGRRVRALPPQETRQRDDRNRPRHGLPPHRLTPSIYVCDNKSEDRVSDFLSQTWMVGPTVDGYGRVDE